MSQEVGSLHATLGLEDTGFKRGLDQAKQALNEAARMTQDATRFMAGYEQAQQRESAAAQRAAATKRQQIAIERELLGAKAQLAAVLGQESAAAQAVAQKYSLLTTAQQRELIAVKEQITAQKALQEAQLATAAATEKAALATERAAAKQVAAAQRNLGRNLQGAGRALTGAFTTPIVGAALAAGYAGQQVQEAEAGLRAGTGLTGDRLQSVQESFKKIAPQVSQPLKEVGSAVAELERRTGLTGDALEKLAVSELNLQRITQSGKEIFKDTAQLFTAWNVPLAQQIPLLDEVNRAHQLTGISTTKLLEAVTRTAPTFRAMGKGVEDSIATFAAFDKAGIVPERLITALNAGLGRLAKAGVPDAGKAMGDMLLRIQNLKDPTQALNEAVRLLGVRGGTQLADALRTGKLSLEGLENSIKHGSDTIASAAKDTETFSVVWGRMRNAVEIALAPIGKVILQFVLLAAQALRPAVEWLGRVGEAFSKLSPSTQGAILGTLAVVAALGPLLVQAGKVYDGVIKMQLAWKALTLAFGETSAIRAGFTAVTAGLAEVTAASVASFLVMTAGWGAVALGVYAVSQNIEELKGGMRILGRVAGGQSPADAMLQEGKAITEANNRRLDTKFGGGGTVPQPLYDDDPARGGKRIVTPAPGTASRRLPGLTPAEQKALFGAGKQSPLDREQKAFTEELAQAHSRLSEVLLGEDKIAERVAGKYHLLTAAQRAQLVTVLEQLQKGEELRKAQDAIEKNTRIRTALAKGESPEVARLSAEYEHLSRGQRQAIVSSQAMTEKALQAAASQKEYTKDLGKLNAEIRRLKGGHDAEAAGVDALKEKYPGLSAAMLTAMNSAIQWKKHLVELRQEAHAVAEGIRSLQTGILEAGAGSKLEEAAARLFGPKLLEQGKRPQSAADLFRNYLTPAQQGQAQTEAGTAAFGDIDKQIAAARRGLFTNYGDIEPRGMGLKDRAGQVYASAVGPNENQFLTAPQQDELLRKAKAFITLKDAETQAAAATQMYNGEFDKINAVSGQSIPQLQLLQQQFGILTGRSTVAREVLDKFGVSLKALPKYAQDNLRAFLDMSRGLKFIQDFASGVQGVFRNMFTNLMDHGFKGFFSSVVTGFSQMLQQMAADYLSSQLANVFMNLVGGALGGAVGGGGGSAASERAIFGMAGGGAYTAGKPFWAGERGPELVFPRSSGTVMPHAQSMALAGPHERTVGGSPVTIHMTVVAQDVQSFRAPHNQQAMMGDLQRGIERARRRG